jgi:predicted MPP superfamily phosphohydrolase
MNGIGLAIMVAILVLVEYYAFHAFRYATKSTRAPYKTILTIAYFGTTILWYLMLFSFNYLRTADMSKGLRSAIIVFFMAVILGKLFNGIILMIDDLRRLIFMALGLFYRNTETPQVVLNGMTRSDFLARFAILFGGTMFGTMVYGMSNRYNYSLHKIKIAFDHLPAAFKGLKMIQISDIHSGSLNNKAAIRKGIDLILAQQPDIIFFTGDLVNNKSDEMQEFLDVFSKLRAPLGVYSILGNHDYGDYIEWESAEAKTQNLDTLKQMHAEMGWNLLLNQHVVLEKDGQQIAVLGVENISAKGFHTYGNLQGAYQGADQYPFKILLSHDPSHWDNETTTRFKDIDLTLSGHTHGMQFGVEIPWLKWSPVQYAYNRWAGLYQKDNQYLYVNRGFGFIGYPGRVGILPEITLIELT